MVRGGFADHGGFPSFHFVKHFVEESFRLMVAEVLHPDVSSRGGSKIYTADPGRRRRRVSPTSAGTLAYSCEGRKCGASLASLEELARVLRDGIALLAQWSQSCNLSSYSVPPLLLKPALLPLPP
jgi:hypothetical protein